MMNATRLPHGSVCLHAAALSTEVQGIHHMSTRFSARTDAATTGSTRWERRYADGTAWFEWDWEWEPADGSVSQIDPFNIRSNVLLLDDRGRPLLSSRRRAMLAKLVYFLPWQGAVLDEIRQSWHCHNHDERYHRAAA